MKSLHSVGRPMFPADLTASVDDLPYLLTSARANIDGCVEGLQEFAPDALDTAPGIRLRSEVTLITVTVAAAHACVPCAIDDELSASVGGDSSTDDSADYSAESSADAYEYDYPSLPSRRITTETDQSGDSGAPGWVNPGIFKHLKRIQAAHMRGGDAWDAPGARRLLGLDGAETGDDAAGAEAADAAAQSDSILRRLTDEGVASAYSGDAGDSHESGDTLRRGLQSSSNGKTSKMGVQVGGILDTSGFNGQYSSLLPPRVNAIVAKDGSGTHRTLKAAIASAPMKGTFVIFIKRGVYDEQILFDNQGIVLVGEGMGKTVITGKKSVVGGSTTFNSATLGKHSSSLRLPSLGLSCTLPLSLFGGIVLVGEGMGKTVITGKKSVVGGSTTFNSATLGQYPSSLSTSPLYFIKAGVHDEQALFDNHVNFTFENSQNTLPPFHSPPPLSPFPLFPLLSLPSQRSRSRASGPAGTSSALPHLSPPIYPPPTLPFPLSSLPRRQQGHADSAGSHHPQHSQASGPESSGFTLTAGGSANKGMFTALGITVRNTAGIVGQQAVALRSEDLSAFFECDFDGNQNSLYPHSGHNTDLLSRSPPHHPEFDGNQDSLYPHSGVPPPTLTPPPSVPLRLSRSLSRPPPTSTPGANKGMFTALGITVRNTAGVVGQQAVALRSEDLSAFFECDFDGNQDTLYPHSGRQYFRDCKVGGTVDFIFGKGAAVFDRPQIRLHKDDPVIITAPQNDPTYPEPKGLIIRNAVITADAGVGKA
ncbi:unnamed protein product [Closterium sp. Yama58-4]|nr:unnamed protein product [Closterium sp. Yama58-4]